MRRLLLLILTALLPLVSLWAQEEEQLPDLKKEFYTLPDPITNEYLDSLKIQVADPNDYWMIGVFGGASAQYGYWNPTRYTRWQLQYPVYGFSVVRQFTMFGMFPNMGLELGFQQDYEGYEFKADKTTGNHFTESGAYKAYINVPSAFILSHFHVDFGEHFKVIAKLGLYGGYRLKISRVLEEQYQDYEPYLQYQNQFRDYDRRWTYGLQIGLGFAVMVSPVEFHLTAQGKWGWSSFWQPDYSSKYYYRYGYPLDAALTFGVYYQLTPRLGHSQAQLRALARRMARAQQQQNQQQ